MKLTTYMIIFLSSLNIYANDGAFYMSGNHLIPTTETQIEVKKEILSLKKIKNKYIEVTVYYEFFNPNGAKEIIVGFEAFAPSGDVDGAPKNGNHPYMSDFTVNLNDQILEYKVAYVEDSLYLKNGQIITIDLDTFKGEKSGNDIDFYYVYYFNANFKKGINIIKHTYNFDVSGGIVYNYDFQYILTAAKRWANNQIDDFTMLIDNGEFETFDIKKTFFESKEDWIINGIGKSKDNTLFEENFKTVRFYIQKGNLVFQKKNFIPTGELFIASIKFGFDNMDNSSEPNYLPFSFYQMNYIKEPKNDFERKVYKNLPFARRGYVFKNIDLKKYYDKLDWYIPNPNYNPDFKTLSEKEIEWIEKYK